MKVFIIKYRRRKSDRLMHFLRVLLSPAKAIKVAGIAGEYSIEECTHPYKLGNKYYSPASGTYNAVWLTQGGRISYQGNYCPEDGSYCLYYGNTLLAEGKWEEGRFETYGHYSYNDVRKAIQRGFV